MDVRRLGEEKRIAELEGHVPFAVDQHIINLWVLMWENICIQAFKDIEQDVIGHWETFCIQHFGQFRTSGLLAAVRLTPSVKIT